MDETGGWPAASGCAERKPTTLIKSFEITRSTYRFDFLLLDFHLISVLFARVATWVKIPLVEALAEVPTMYPEVKLGIK